MREKGEAKYIMPFSSPCRDCPEREVGCHGKCEAYAAFRERCDELAEKQQSKREYNEYISETIKRFPGKRSF